MKIESQHIIKEQLILQGNKSVGHESLVVFRLTTVWYFLKFGNNRYWAKEAGNLIIYTANYDWH